MVTLVQLEAYLSGWTTLSWYNILHTVTTQVQTVQTPDSRGRHPLQGRDAPTHSTNTRLKRHTCRQTDRSGVGAGRQAPRETAAEPDLLHTDPDDVGGHQLNNVKFQQPPEEVLKSLQGEEEAQEQHGEAVHHQPPGDQS